MSRITAENRPPNCEENWPSGGDALPLGRRALPCPAGKLPTPARNPARRMRDALPGRYLSGDDLDDEVIVTIDRVVMESFRDPRTRVETRKPVMYFQRAKRGLIVNRTNWRTVADLYGDGSDNWTGKRIGLA